MDSNTERLQFLQAYHRVVNIVKEYLHGQPLPMFLLDHLLKVLDYNVQGGKMIRGMISHFAFLALRGPATNVTEEQACMAGWAIETLQAFFLVADDIMDKSQLRRNKPCWYLQAGASAINDSILLESVFLLILRVTFADLPHILLRLNILFQDVLFKTCLGQALDLKYEGEGLAYMNRKRYKEIVHYKTAFYSFYLPIKIALILCEKEEDEESLVSISMLLGELFQIQDDYLDCFGDSHTTGKMGTDIQDSKCTWCLIKALEVAGGDHEHDNYGRREGVDAVCAYYRRLDLPSLYKTECLELEDKINASIQASPLSQPVKEIQRQILLKISSRSK